jgi:hypothetical protein
MVGSIPGGREEGEFGVREVEDNAHIVPALELEGKKSVEGFSL